MKEINLRNIVGIVNPASHIYLPACATPESGTEINLSGEVLNGSTTVRTTAANKKILLTDIIMTWEIITAGIITFQIFNAVPTNVFNPIRLESSTTTIGSISPTFSSPIELPAGWSIRVLSNNANSKTQYYIHAWEIDV